MSRSNVFSRIATWLKDAANLNELRLRKEAQANMRRQYTVQTLEDRQMLAADFLYDVGTESLAMDNFSEVVQEGLTIDETGSHYRFILAEGVWTGVDVPAIGIEGNGSQELRIDKTALGPTDINSILIDDGIGIDVRFDNVNFSASSVDPILDFQINSSRGDITQSPLDAVQFGSLVVNGADNVILREINNQFSSISITDTNVAEIRDNDSLVLGRIQINGDAEFENDGLMQIDDVFEIGGNVLLNSNNGDILQEIINDRNAAIIVQGKTFLKSNAAGQFGIYLGFGDRDADGINDNDFVGEVVVLQAAEVEIRDVNDITIGDVTTHTVATPARNQVYVEAENGTITVAGTVSVQGDVDVDGKVFLRASDGVIQTNQGIIVADDLILVGQGDFILDGDNVLFDNDNVRQGRISADVTGDLVLNNTEALEIARNSYTFPDIGTGVRSLAISSLRVRTLLDGSKGNAVFSTTDDNITQQSGAPIIVDQLTQFAAGTGNVTLEFGDELGNLLNDNNWNRLEVISGGTVSFMDEDELIVGDVSATGSARFQTQNEKQLFFDGAIVVSNNVFAQSDLGATQLSGSIDARGLMVEGVGDFVFDFQNALGDAGTFGDVAADIEDGELILKNQFGLESDSINSFGTTIVGISGNELRRVWLQGDGLSVADAIESDLVFLESNKGISQVAAITTPELMILSEEDVNLTSNNMVDVVAINSNGNVNYTSDIAFEVGSVSFDLLTLAGITLESTIDNNLLITTTNDDVVQAMDAPIIVDGTVTIDIGTGCVDFVFGDGNADTVNDNDFTTIAILSALQVEIVDRDSFTTGDIDVTEQIRLQSETGTIFLGADLTAGTIVLLQSGDGVEQIPDAFGALGVITTPALMLEGTGDFLLSHDNQIGSATVDGLIAVDIVGVFELNNAFGLRSVELEFLQKDGVTVTIAGFNVDSGGDALILNVNGLTIETEIVAPKIVINTTGDIIQSPSGRLVTDQLVLTGTGNFDLNALNQIGTAAVPGVVAISVEGDVSLTNEFSIVFDTIVCGTDTFAGATLIPNGTAAGDLTLTVVDADVTQANDSIFEIMGLTTFDVGTGSVNLLGFATETNDFSVLVVESAGIVEIADRNSITLDAVTVTNDAYVRSGDAEPGAISLNGNINVGDQLLLESSSGVAQLSGNLVVGTLMLKGANDFELLSANEVGNVSANILGSLHLTNSIDLNIVKDSYTTIDGDTTSFLGVNIDQAAFDGNLEITTSNDSVSQDADAQISVAETALFTLGSGELDLTFGDSNGDLLNDNDLNVLAVASASHAEVVDFNSISLDNSNISGKLFVESEGGSISIQGQVSADDQIMLRALAGAGTRIGASLDTNELLIEGLGDFDLSGDNRIGSFATPGSFAADVDGDVLLNNQFGVHFDDLTFTQMDGTVNNLVGVNVDAGLRDGNFFVAAEGDITDNDSVNIIVEGHAAFVASDVNDVELGQTNTLTSTSIGLGGRNANIVKSDAVVLDGVSMTGALDITSIGGIQQSGLDVSGLVGARFVEVGGNSVFTVDSTSGAVEELSVNLQTAGVDLANNEFGGDIVIQGTSFTGTGTASGQLGSVQVRNAIVDAASFPTINRVAGDRLKNVTIWAPNSSLLIKDLGGAIDYDVEGNMTIFAGVDSETGMVGGRLKVTDNAKTRSLRDETGVSINVDGSLFTNAANTLVLADHAGDSITVGGRLSLVNQGGANENRIRLGVQGGAVARGTDSGANVVADTLRVRANRNGTDGHVTVNMDSDIDFTNSNFATSLVAVSSGNISDEATASIVVANGASFDGGDVVLGDDNATNTTNFGSVGFNANNVELTEDTSVLLNGSAATGVFDILAKGSIRQTGVDAQGRAGTDFIEVGGDATFTVDATIVPVDHLQDGAGRDVMLVANGSKDVMNNVFDGTVTVQTTQKLSGGNGTLRSVGIRNIATDATVPVINTTEADPLKNLTIWFPNSSVDFVEQSNSIDYDIAGNLNVYSGVDSANGKSNGVKSIVNDAVSRNITDASNVSITVGRNARFQAANRIQLVDEASNSLVVGVLTQLTSEGGADGNRIDVGTLLTSRGTDSGGEFETKRLKFTIEDTGIGGNLTVVADLGFTLDASSSAPSVVLSP